jgi:hypothetical protein
MTDALKTTTTSDDSCEQLPQHAPGHCAGAGHHGAGRFKPTTRPPATAKQGGAEGNRTRPENTHETLENKPDRAPGGAEETSTLATNLDPPKPAEAAPGPVPPSEAELERAIVQAVTLGAVDVARTLAVQLEKRRQVCGVIDIRAHRPRGL